MGWRAVSWLIVLVGCAHPRGLPQSGVEALQQAAAEPRGELVYEGTVRAIGDDAEPLYRYERRVADEGDGLCSSHLTIDPDGEPVLVHRAVHSDGYTLTSFREVHAQTGLIGDVQVHGDGTASFRTVVDGRLRQREERAGAPLQVGPTLFGYVRENWDALLDGERLPIRFVVLDKGRSYRFVLEVSEGPEGVVVEMVPASPLLAMALPTTRMVFDGDRRVLRYEGRVPPLRRAGRRLVPLDAVVSYRHITAAYR